MRLKIDIESRGVLLPFAHQHLLVGTIHKWLGYNDLHGTTSFFSFSRLSGGEVLKEQNGIWMERETGMLFSAHDSNILLKLINGIKKDPTLFFGLTVKDITIFDDPDLTEREVFYPTSPILLKLREENKNYTHLTYTDPRANELLTDNFRGKLRHAGLEDSSVSVEFVHDIIRPRTMLIDYKGVKSKTSWCAVRIKGSPESKLFAWNAGLGNSTGIGFGAIK